MEEFFQSLKENWLDTSKALQYLYSVEICGGIGPTRNDEERESCHHGTSELCQEQKHVDEIILEEKVNDYESLHECSYEEWLNKYMLSLSSGASSLNSVSHSPCDTTRAMQEYSQRRSPSAFEKAAREFTENTYQEEYATARPLSDSSAKLQADSDEMSSNEEGLLSKENHPATETVAVKDSLEQRDQEFKQRRQPNCICARHQSNDIVAKQLQVKIEDLLHKLDQLQAENIFYVDRCRNQEKEIAQLKENLTQIEEEKQGLESEMGRQLFLEDKNKRQSKLYQPFTEHCHGQIMPNAGSGASFHVTGLDGEQLDKAGPCNNSDIYKADSSSGRCGFASSCSQSSSSSAVNVQSLTKDLHSAEIITGLNPDHPALKAWKNSGESASDTTSGGEEKEERSMPLLLTNECFESEEEEQGCASKEEGGKEGSGNSTSICDGAVNASYLIQHCNAVYVVDSPDYTSSRAQDSVKLKNVSGLSQDLLPPEGMPQKKSVSCATTTAQKVDLVPQQVGEPVVQGGINAFLARLSKDKHLHESLYYNSADEMLAKDMDSMMNMFDSNKAKPYLDDCQAAAMSDPYYQPYSSAFSLPSEAYIGEDGFPLDYAFNSNSVLPPGPSSSYIGASMSQNSYFNSFNPNIGSDFALDTSEPQLLQNGRLTSLQGSDFLQSGFTSSGLTSDFLGTTGPQMTHSVIGTQSNIGFTGSTSILHPEPLQMQTPSTTNVGLLESYNEMPTTCKENLTQIEEEKQGLESEVGRQLFLEDENKRQSKLYQPFPEHCHEQIMPNAASGASFHVTGLDREQLDIAGPCNNSDIYKADSSSGRCGFASSCSQSSSSSAFNVQSLTKDLHSAEIITRLNPDHPALKAWKNSGESASDTTSGGEEKEERSMPLLLTSECFESEEEEQGCASKEEGGKEGSVDLVPQQVGEPVVLGVDNAFLTRHSVDKPLGGSLYYNDAEMVAEDMDSMMTMIDSNQAKPYLGDCQAAAMSDPYYQPYSSAFPLPSEAYIGEDGFPLDYTFNGNSVLPPGPLSGHVGASMSQNGHLTSLQRSDFLQSGFTSSGLTSDFLGTTGPQMTQSVFGTQGNIGFTGSTSILHPEPLQMQTPSTTNVGLLESYNEMPTTCNVDSLDSTHNSPQAFVQGVRDAWMRVSAQFRRWWCTCSAQYDQDASPAVCTTCHKYRYLGQPRVQSCYDECCICHMDLSSGLLILPCSHRAHMECTSWLIQHNILHCPSCFGVFFHQGNCAPRCSPRLFK